MRVKVIGSAGEPACSPASTARIPDCWGPWRPQLTLGASSLGGLMLPDAQASAATMYAPRGVWIDTDRIVVSDTGNHRVLIWHGLPVESGAAADIVLGQPGFDSEGPATGGPAGGMNLPTGVLVDHGRLVVADAWHHRILVWNRVPERNSVPPDHVIGQSGPEATAPNAGGDPDGGCFYWPFGIAVIDGRFYVADTGNRRILCWSGGLPLDGRPADVVLGQPAPDRREENRGGDADGHSFRWPHAIASTGDGGVFVADAGNHRIMRWHEHPGADEPADAVIGQPDFTSVGEFPYQSQEGRLRFPYGLAAGGGAVGGDLAVADTANNRVLIWDQSPRAGGEPPDAALAQPNFAAAGENRWDAVTDDTLCWPYGLARSADLLAVADSGNNRVTIWARGQVY